MTTEKTENNTNLNVVELPVTGLRNYPKLLRKLADIIEDGKLPPQKAIAMVCMDDDNGVHMYHWGEGGEEILALMLGRAHLQVLNGAGRTVD